MNPFTLRRPLFLGLAVLALWPGLALRADGGSLQTTGVDLRLEEALPQLEFDLDRLPDEQIGLALSTNRGLAPTPSQIGDVLSAQDGAGTTELDQMARITSTAIDKMWQAPSTVGAQTSMDSSSPAKQKPRWKKKKWWIPVVAAVVIGVAASGGDGDDTIDDGED